MKIEQTIYTSSMTQDNTPESVLMAAAQKYAAMAKAEILSMYPDAEIEIKINGRDSGSGEFRVYDEEVDGTEIAERLSMVIGRMWETRQDEIWA